MSADDVEVASRFLAAVERAARIGDREPVYGLLATDVVWVAPQRTLQGIDEVREKHIWGYPPEEKLDIDFEGGDWVELGDGCLACDVRELYRWRETGETAHHRDRRIEVTIRDGRISRYEMHNVG